MHLTRALVMCLPQKDGNKKTKLKERRVKKESEEEKHIIKNIPEFDDHRPCSHKGLVMCWWPAQGCGACASFCAGFWLTAAWHARNFLFRFAHQLAILLCIFLFILCIYSRSQIAIFFFFFFF